MNATQVPSNDTVRARKFKSLLQANNISPLALAQSAQVGEEFVFEALRGKAQMPYFWTRCFACLGVTPDEAKAQFGIVWDKHAIPAVGLTMLVKTQPEERNEVNRKKYTHPERAARLKDLMDKKKVRAFEIAEALGINRRLIDEARSTGCTTPRSWALILTYLGATKAQATEWGIPWEDATPRIPPALPKPPDCRCILDTPLVPEAVEQLVQANGKDHTPASLATEDRNKVTQALEHLFDARDLILSTQTENQGQLWRKLIETVEAL